MLRSDLYDYNDAYIVVEGVVTVSADERDRDEMDRDFVLKNNAPFISCISKKDGVLTENPDDLHVAMPIYNLLEYLVHCGIIIKMNQLMRQMIITAQTKM